VIDFLVLGPLEVRDDGRSIVLGAGRQRAVLAVLLLHANEVVSTDRLIDILWGAHPPETAAKVLQNQVSQLRRAIGAGVIATRAPGYVLTIEPGQVDSHRFEQAVEGALRAPAMEGSELLRQALALWRGPAFADFAFEEFAQAEIARLEELRLVALEERIEADATLGRHAELVSELEALVARHPLRERLRAQQMLALYRCGRQAEALDAYRGAREALLGGLGLEPGERLQQLQRAILSHDPALEPPARVPRPAPPLERILRRPLRLILLGALLAAGAAVAAGVELSGGSRAVAVRPNSVVVIDPKSRRIVGDVPVGMGPLAVVAGDGAVWVANAADGTISRIDPRTRRVVATIGIGSDVSDLALGFGSLWVAGGNDGTLTRIDTRQNLVQATIRLGRSTALAPAAAFAVVTGAHAVWVGRGDMVLRVDPSTNRVSGRLPLRAALGAGLAANPNALWVATGSEQLLRVEAGAYAITAHTSLPSLGYLSKLGFGRLWLAIDLGHGDVWSLDPNSLDQLAGTRTSPGLLTGLAVGEGAVWAATASGDVWQIDPASVTVTGHTRVGQEPGAIAAGQGEVWLVVP
jgi:DNA-binding SARP family transcriptional activator/streptogramin lyase